MGRSERAATGSAVANPSGIAAADLPATYTPRVAGYARGPFLTPILVTPTDWRWKNCRTYLVKHSDGHTYRAVRVVDARTHEVAGYWAVELLGDMLPALPFEPNDPLDLAVRVAKAQAGLDPDEPHVPALFIDHLPESWHPQFWDRQIRRFLDNDNPA